MTCRHGTRIASCSCLLKVVKEKATQRFYLCMRNGSRNRLCRDLHATVREEYNQDQFLSNCLHFYREICHRVRHSRLCNYIPLALRKLRGSDDKVLFDHENENDDFLDDFRSRYHRFIAIGMIFSVLYRAGRSDLAGTNRVPYRTGLFARFSLQFLLRCRGSHWA